MHPTRSICVFCALAVMAGALSYSEPRLWADDRAPAAADNDDRAKPQEAERVILRLGRDRELAGYLELEEDDVIVIRTLRDEVRSFSRMRVLEVIRLVDPEPGQRGIVLLRNGQQREGVILEDTFEYVLVEIEGIPARLRREHVDYVVLEPTFDQRYVEFRKTLKPGMFDQHMHLCKWLIENRRYELAHENLMEILQQKEIHEARRMLRVVEAQLELRRLSETSAEHEPEQVAQRSKDSTRLPPRLLTRDEVNLIRVYEIDFDDPPRVTVPPDAVREMFEMYGANDIVPASRRERNAMIRGEPLRIVRMMFELRARELYPQIEVHSEPPSMNMFRRRVHNTWLLNNCATSGCHGGPHAGDLMLHRDGYVDDRVRYTNFLILEQLEVDPEWPLINYNDPEMSLIVQYGLPRDVARLPHPEVRGWSPVFARKNDRMLQDTLRWIGLMMQPRPEYPIEFDPLPQDAQDGEDLP